MFSVTNILVFYLLIAVGLSSANEKINPKCFFIAKKLQNCCKIVVHEHKIPQECMEHVEGLKNAEAKGRIKAEACLSECFSKSLGIINAANEIDKEKLLIESENVLKDHPDFKKMVPDVVDKCLKFIKENKYHQMSNEGGNECGFTPYILNMCIGTHMTKHCPESYKDNSAECQAVRVKFDEECKEI